MLFVFYPKHQYGCPNVNHCPHLGGAALGSLVFAATEQHEWTDSLWRQIDGLRESEAAQARQIKELKEQLEQVKRELKAERQKQFKATTPEEEVPVDADEPPAEAKKRGAPVGHPGWFRPTPTHIDRTIIVLAPTKCPHCDVAVIARPDLPPYDHLQEDFIDGQPMTTCYRHEEGRCSNPQCRRWVRQPGRGEILRAKIGPEMRARGIFLRFDIGLPFRKVVAAIEGLDALSFTPAALLGFEKRAAEKARPLAHDVALKLRACEVNHADETYYRINGKPACAWFHGNEHLAHFYICGTRSGKISRKILGKDYAGGLVMDCYTGYNRHATKIKQRCVEHLKRSAKNWQKVTPKKATASRQFFDDVRAWTKRCCRWHRRWKVDSGPEKDREAAWLRAEQARLENVVSFRQACMNRFEGRGMVGCRVKKLRRTTDGYQEDERRSGGAGIAPAAIRAFARRSQATLTHSRSPVGRGGEVGRHVWASPDGQNAARGLLFSEEAGGGSVGRRRGPTRPSRRCPCAVRPRA
jgi:transposase